MQLQWWSCKNTAAGWTGEKGGKKWHTVCQVKLVAITQFKQRKQLKSLAQLSYGLMSQNPKPKTGTVPKLAFLPYFVFTPNFFNVPKIGIVQTIFQTSRLSSVKERSNLESKWRRLSLPVTVEALPFSRFSFPRRQREGQQARPQVTRPRTTSVG